MKTKYLNLAILLVFTANSANAFQSLHPRNPLNHQLSRNSIDRREFTRSDKFSDLRRLYYANPEGDGNDINESDDHVREVWIELRRKVSLVTMSMFGNLVF